MSNLGWYQIMTTMAKKVGGPLKLAGLFFGGGAVVGGGAVAGGVAIKNKVAKKLDEKKREAAAAVVHTVTTEEQSNEGLVFKVGDQFKVLEVDGDAALIEKLGDNNNPYFVSADFLKSISDYE
jgi:hypothetical protein